MPTIPYFSGDSGPLSLDGDTAGLPAKGAFVVIHFGDVGDRGLMFRDAWRDYLYQLKLEIMIRKPLG